MSARLELLVAREDRRILLRSPEVGFFTHALPAGSLLGPGAHAGVLRSLGKSFALAVPAGVQGRVTSAAPELVQLPVGYGTVLYELDPLEAGAPDRAEKTRDTESARNELVFRAPYSGRFWQRPSPHDPPFVRAGDVIGDGQTIGLIEVNEAFAAAPIALMREFGMRDRDRERINVNGGACAIGHPVGASGARLVGTIGLEMQKRGVRYGLATICGGMGQGAATVLELCA